MTFVLSTTVRDVCLDSIESTIGQVHSFYGDGRGGVVEVITHNGKVLGAYLVYSAGPTPTGRQRTRRLWRKRGRR